MMHMSKTLKYMITFNKPTAFQAMKSYKNSQAQKNLHDYVRDEKQLQKKKKQIDYKFISKQSAGVIQIRQFRFQEKTDQILVPHLDCELYPNDTWTEDQILKELNRQKPETDSEIMNKQILAECQEDLKKGFVQYYNNLGKKNYQFNFEEQINKIQFMTEEEFKDFTQTLNRNRFKDNKDI